MSTEEKTLSLKLSEEIIKHTKVRDEEITLLSVLGLTILNILNGEPLEKVVSYQEEDLRKAFRILEKYMEPELKTACDYNEGALPPHQD
jgi:hypothetical protein